MKNLFLFLCLLSILAAPGSAAGAAELTIRDGRLGLSDGAPLSGYQADAAVIERWRSSPSVPFALKLREKYPAWRALAPEEIVGIMAYVGSGYEAINSQLWNGTLPQSLDDLDTVKLMLSGLNKLPDYECGAIRTDFYAANNAQKPDPAAVAKRAALYTAAFEQHKPFLLRAFWSASRVSTQAARRRILSRYDILLKIHSLTGKSIDAVSHTQAPDEEEVLFRPGTRFEVAGKNSHETSLPGGKKKTRYQFTLCELQQDGSRNCGVKVCCRPEAP